MKILAIDTSSKICGVAIIENEKILIKLINDDEKTHSVKLMPMIDKAFKDTNLSLDNISLLACCTGPGSFTGVRIGIATIKAFSDVKNIPVVGITSLESLAYNVKKISKPTSLICSLIDAKNENVYCGLYNFSNDLNYANIFAENIDITISKTSNIINEKQFTDVIFVGDGSKIYKEKLENSLKNSIFATENDDVQNIISIANIAFNKYNNGEYGNSSSLSPIYLKKSQAEREFEEKIKILPMTNEDIDFLSTNLNSDFDDFWNINNLKNDFLNPNSTYLIAKVENEIVGFAGFLKICDEANIMNIVTKKNKRNLGIGSKLLENLILYAKNQNCKSITLEVNEHNNIAIHLYEKYNFKRIGLRKKYYNNTDDAILMAR